MLFDFGPPIGWWCNPFERFNALLANVPRNQSFIEVGIMQRFHRLQTIGRVVDREVVDATRRLPRSFMPGIAEYELISHMLSGSIQSVERGGKNGLHEAVRVTANRRQALVYRYVGKREVEFQKHVDMRCGKMVSKHVSNDVTGAESYPGRFVGPRTDARLESKITVLANKITRTVSPDYAPYNSLMAVGHVVDVLRIMYATMYRMQIRNAAFNERTTHQAVTEWEKQHPLSELEQMSREQLMHHVTTCYQHKVSADIAIYGAVDIAGEIFGSIIAPRRQRSSYVIINFHKENTNKWVPYYAQVLFYFAHVFLGKTHHFAAVNYYGTVVPSAVGSSSEDQRKEHTKEHTKEHKYAIKTFARVKRQQDDPSMFNIIPLVRLKQRFIPADMDNLNMTVIPIPSKWHM